MTGQEESSLRWVDRQLKEGAHFFEFYLDDQFLSPEFEHELIKRGLFPKLVRLEVSKNKKS